jgi:glutamate racemase
MTSPNPQSAIGIFDSGLGGLTVAGAVHRAFPHEAICYLGDTARVPYGAKSPETVQRYAREDIAFLLQQGVKVIVAACNTVSAAALPELANHYPVPVLGVVEMGVETALESSPRRIGVIGTQTTVGSEAYVRAIHRRVPDVSVIQKACPLFVPLIEEGWTDHAVTRAVIQEYLSPMRDSGVDGLILGCTHYPLIRALLGEFFGSAVRMTDSAEAMVRALRQSFDRGELPRAEGNHARCSRYYVTDRSNRFEQLVTAFMGEDDLQVQQIRPDELAMTLEKDPR